MENMVIHPSLFISTEDVKTIRDYAPEAEQLAMLHPKQLEIIYHQNWFKLLVPAQYGGQQIELPSLVRLQEGISWADGSTGWVVTLCSGAGWFGGFLNAKVAQNVFQTAKICLAGSGAVGGIASITPTGYKITGKWKYASGAHHATHITANCKVERDGNPVYDNDGEALVLPFILDKKDINILPAWKYIGMVATGSDAFEINGLEVSFDRQFKIDGASAVINEQLYKYPFLQLAEATLAVNLSGIAMHFIDLCQEIFDDKLKQPKLTAQQKKFLVDELATVKIQLDQLRKALFEAVSDSWSAFQLHPDNAQDQLKAVSATSRSLAQFARQGVDRLYPLCGLIAASMETEINRTWRDLHTASQHSLLTFAF